jgi:hypothetical protein
MTEPRSIDRSAEIGEQLRAIASDVQAPATLRASVAQARLRSAPVPRRRRRFALTALALIGVTLAAVLVALPAGDGAPSIDDVASISLRDPTQPAPGSLPGGGLALAVGGVRFPGAGDGWKPVGARSDRVGDRSAQTVTYARGRDAISYTIVDGPALPAPPQNLEAYENVSAAVFRRGDALVLTWRRGGRTCVLTSRDVGARRMLELAARS